MSLFGGTSGGGFSFGAPTSAPAAAAPAAGSGFSFGATTSSAIQQPQATTATPAFGLTGAAKPAGLGLSFNAPAASTAPTAAVAPNTGFSLGAAPSAFGAASTTQSAFSLPKPTGSVAPSFGLGSTVAPVSAAGTSAFGFGAPTASTATAAPAFGSLTTPASTTLAASVAPSLSFGAPAATSAPAFGTFGTAVTSGSASTSGFSLTQPVASSGAPAFGSLATTTASAFGGGGLGGAAAPIAATTTTFGLGGTAPAASSAASTATATSDNRAGPAKIKDGQIPKELMQTVDTFKKYVKEEKSVGSDVAHTSAKLHSKIGEDTASLGSVLRQLSASLAHNRSQLERLKLDAAKELGCVEVAQRTRDTPPQMQYENVAPLRYFAAKVTDFEAQMAHYRRQIEETERSLQALAQGTSGGSAAGQMSWEEVLKGLAKLETTFTNVSGRYREIHEAVSRQKELFLQLNRHKYGEDIFEKNKPSSVAKKAPQKSGNPLIYPYPSRIPADYVGPSPFEGQDPLSLARASLAAAATTQPPVPQQQQFGGISAFAQGSNSFLGQQQQSPMPGLGLRTSAAQPGLLGTTVSPFAAAGQSPFQTGGKRGKH